VRDDWLEPLSCPAAAPQAEAAAFDRGTIHPPVTTSKVTITFSLKHSKTIINRSGSHLATMGDPLSITASVVGIATAALQSLQFLVQAIDGVNGAPDVVKSVSTDLRAIRPVLQTLLRAVQDDSSQVVLSEHIKDAIENCQRACGTFQLRVEHWTERSTKDKMFWVDRWKVGLFGLERIKAFRGQLSDCKGTLTFALSTATVY
jgi:hypothetical protein